MSHSEIPALWGLGSVGVPFSTRRLAFDLADNLPIFACSTCHRQILRSPKLGCNLHEYGLGLTVCLRRHDLFVRLELGRHRLQKVLSAVH